ncbi:helix-hairpin-helix domain-containing protein (plasmid) [Rhodococcus aetherivorans]|uniref:ComEA family DNA-binding protein n=1 Tax=Rhodococcus aetherivorans TaxID=191292 RepID=UPI0031D0851A
MTTPEERLCSRSWRLRHSAWTLWTLLSFGLFTFCGFLIIGLKARNRMWLLSAAGWFVYTVGMFIAMSTIDSGTKENPSNSVAYNISAAVFFLAWIGGIVHVFITNRAYLRWKAHDADTPWYAGTSGPAQPTGPPSSPGSGSLPPAVDSAMRGYTAPPTTPAPPWPGPQPTNTASDPRHTTSAQAFSHPRHDAASAHGAVDVNRAGVEELQRTLGLDAATAHAVVTTRARLGRYVTPDQLMTEAGIPPHIYLSLKNRIDTPSAPTPPSTPHSPGRRLEF